jgi:hypothetical protein
MKNYPAKISSPLEFNYSGDQVNESEIRGYALKLSV